MRMKEFSADQILTLMFMSLGPDEDISVKDINDFVDILKDFCDKDFEKEKFVFGINIPMNENYDITLFREIKDGPKKGNLIMIKCEKEREKEIQKMKLTKYFIELVGDNQIFKTNCKKAVKEFNLRYEKMQEQTELLSQSVPKTFFGKVKEIVKSI